MMLTDLLKNKTVILGSRSPRRHELLAGAGIDHRVADDLQVEETYPEEMPLANVAGYLSMLKSEAYPHPLGPDEILITADTVVIAQGEILGKPTDRTDALRMLTLLSGGEHDVVTGVTIRTADRIKNFSSSTNVIFRTLSLDEMEYYVDKFRPMDKAGAYGIQEWIGYVGIERIKGSFYNVMGLPVQRVYVELEWLLKN